MFTTFFDGRRIGLINKSRDISIGSRIGIDFFDVSKFRFYDYPTVVNLAAAHCGGSVLSIDDGSIDRAYFDGRDLHISHMTTVVGVTSNSVKTIPDICERGE